MNWSFAAKNQETCGIINSTAVLSAECDESCGAEGVKCEKDESLKPVTRRRSAVERLKATFPPTTFKCLALFRPAPNHLHSDKTQKQEVKAKRSHEYVLLRNY